MMRRTLVQALVTLAVSARVLSGADDPQLAQKLKAVDAFVEKTLKDWNVPGIGLGIVLKDKLVHAKGYGFRDYGRKLPYKSDFTRRELFERLKFLELTQPMRQTFLYNNMMCLSCPRTGSA